jgi:hypothetical protein
MNSKRFIGIVTVITLVLLVGFASITIYIDPYFHYHKPIESLQYKFQDQRYINDGIIKHFDYDTIITGTSMIENFKTTECDLLFGSNSIKVPYSGGYYKEIDQSLKRAIKANPNIKLVIRSLDYSKINKDKDDARYELETYPEYLYNYSYFDDVNYVLNKDIMIKNTEVLKYTRKGNVTTSFDRYSNWNKKFTFGKETVLRTYERPEKVDKIRQLNDKEIKTIKDNIYQNVEETAKENPDITFYLFFTPYSISYWDILNQSGKVQYHIDTERLVIEQLLKYDNIKLFSFSNNFELVCNLNNYKDQAHYGQAVNSKMLEWMKAGDYELTYNNYEDYLNQLENFYLNYDYDSIYKNE